MTVVVKLGGSVITDKSRYRALDAPTLKRLASEIADSGDAAAVVHGAGSFGHILAKEYKLVEGGGREKAMPFARVHLDVKELSVEVLRALQAEGLAAVGLPPFALAGDTVAFLERVADALDHGLTPVTHGDAVLDPKRGFTILSGDTLVVHIARGLHADRVVLATDVDGLFDKDPKQGGSKLLEHVTTEAVALRSTVSGSTAPDVTGGMAGKVKALLGIAAAGIPVTIVNGRVPGRVADAIAGRAVKGTVIDG